MSTSRDKTASNTDHRHLWYTRCPVPTAFGLVIKLGWLEQEFLSDGITVSSLLHHSERAVRESHFSHTLPDSFRHGGNIPAIWARSQGADSRLIGISWTKTPQVILALPESGIRGPADLKGRRLGLTRRADSIDFWRATGLRIYQVALQTAGLSLKDVHLVDIPIQRGIWEQVPKNSGTTGRLHRDDLFALARGEIDAIYSEGVFAEEVAAFVGAHTVYDLRQNPDRFAHTNNDVPLTFAASGKLVDERPDLVARVLARTIEAGRWAQTHHSEVVRIIASEGGHSEEAVELTYGPALSQQLEVDLSPEKIEAIRQRKKFLLRHGFIKEFDLENWIDQRPLEQARRILNERVRATENEGAAGVSV